MVLLAIFATVTVAADDVSLESSMAVDPTSRKLLRHHMPGDVAAATTAAAVQPVVAGQVAGAAPGAVADALQAAGAVLPDGAVEPEAAAEGVAGPEQGPEAAEAAGPEAGEGDEDEDVEKGKKDKDGKDKKKDKSKSDDDEDDDADEGNLLMTGLAIGFIIGIIGGFFAGMSSEAPHQQLPDEFDVPIFRDLLNVGHGQASEFFTSLGQVGISSTPRT
eukprot:CAMPEP_0118923812 /NCGR_PEP_ID=MMETSP1169-20130426/2205_1 /TAXON_ID=36882 /ORGANISM="Pyramimonas obovata, Strain CCMP722" /LENGTH=217 /DNA_ID=CAMNT_0006864861 /DNA_START=182 /DNA_END=836 /DNA_ORIENTATION=-